MTLVRNTVRPAEARKLGPQQGYTITGTVYDSDGTTPIPGVVVATQSTDPEWAYAIAGEDGSYVLTVATPGHYAVHVQSEEYPNGRVACITVPPSLVGVDLVLPARYTLSGAVYDHNHVPVANVDVETGWDDPIHASTRTFADGAYELMLIAGAYHLLVSDPDHPNITPQEVVVSGDTPGVDVALPRPYTVVGRVTDHRGAGLWRATVNTALYDPLDASALTDASGYYTLTLLAGAYTLEAHPIGRSDVLWQVLAVTSPRDRADFSFPELASLRGTVRDAGGQPLPGVEVQAESVVCDPNAYVTVADARGLYTFTLPVGSYILGARRGNYAALPVAPVDLPETTIRDLTIPLPTLYEVRGAVRGSGRPLDQTSVAASTCGRPGDSPTTRTDGAYTLRLAAGVYSLSVYRWRNDYTQAQMTVTVASDLAGRDFALVPSPSISGRVVDGEGRPVAGADVEVISGPAGGSATSDLCGRYMLKLPRDGAYTLRAHSGTALSARQTALVPPSREDVHLTLGAPAQGYPVTFRVVDQAGQGVPGAGLSVESDSTVDYGRTDSAGLFTATLPAGAYQWGAYAECMVDSATHSFSLPGTSSEQLSLHRVTNRVSGRVTDRYRRPLYGANVTAQGAASALRVQAPGERRSA